MKYLKTYESLGVSHYLTDLVDSVISELKKDENYVLKTKMHGKDITVRFKKLKKNNDVTSYFQVLNPEKFIFNIRYGNFDDIPHELKHLDRVLRRDMNADQYYYLNHVGNDVVKKYKHLLHSENISDILTSIFYFFDPNEYEAHYQSFYWDLKKLIKPEMSSEEKRKIIKNHLEDSNIYTLYKFFYNRGGFDLSVFFKDKRGLNEYLSIFLKKLIQFRNDATEYNEWNTLMSKINTFLNRFRKDDDIEVDSLVKEINNLINKMLFKGYKKFHRLYVIFE